MPEPIDNSNDCVPCIFGTCFSKENGILGPKIFFACGAPKGPAARGAPKPRPLAESPMVRLPVGVQDPTFRRGLAAVLAWFSGGLVLNHAKPV